ncbi:hypothetical protein Tco_1051920 [Tanacetum coccineum]
MFGVGRGMLIGLRGEFQGINEDFYWLEETLTVEETNPFDDPDKILDRRGWSVGNFKEVEGDGENKTKEESEQSETEENDASSSEADDLEELDYDPKDDEGFDNDEHILQDVPVSMNNFTFNPDTKNHLSLADVEVDEHDIDVIDYDSFRSDLDNGIDPKRRGRVYLMKRIIVVQKVIAKTGGPLTPTVIAIFDDIKSAASHYNVEWNGGSLYQVNGPWVDQCVVDMDRRVCSYRKWELTGILCKHAMVVIYNMYENGMRVGIPKNWVHAAYKLEMWAHVYSLKSATPSQVVGARNGSSQAIGSSQQSATPSQVVGAMNCSSQPSAKPSQASQGPSQ